MPQELRSLDAFAETRRLIVIAAHPDDRVRFNCCEPRRPGPLDVRRNVAALVFGWSLYHAPGKAWGGHKRDDHREGELLEHGRMKEGAVDG